MNLVVHPAAMLDIARPRQQMFQPSQPLCFMHIPKTSGVALRGGLAEAVAKPAIAYAFDRSLFGGFNHFDSLDNAAAIQICHAPDALPADAPLVMGHFALSTLRKGYPSSQILTILREPTSRLLSHWLFWRQIDDEFLGAWGSWGDFVRRARRPLARFL